MAEIEVMVVILEDDVDPLEGNMAHMVADRVALINDHVNADIVGGIITFLKSAREIWSP